MGEAVYSRYKTVLLKKLKKMRYKFMKKLYTGKTKSRTEKFSNGHSRHYAPDEKRRQYRTSKHRYIFITGDKRQKRDILRQIKYPILKEYPKGDGRKYDTDNPIPLKQTKGE